MLVPDNKIAVIPFKEDEETESFNLEDLNTFIRPLNLSKKRDWFETDFYKCLPLLIGNMQGFVVSIPFEFDVMWNGGKNPQDIFFKTYEDEKLFRNKSHISVISHFGRGIFTIKPPVIFKTPPGINLMTIAPPNFPTPGLSPMSGVIESDNLRYIFTMNIKIDIPDVWIKINANYPLVGILPIPRYFCDSFELIDAKNIDSDNSWEQERQVAKEHSIIRHFLYEKFPKSEKQFDRSYFSGTDIRGNKFTDHQISKLRKK